MTDLEITRLCAEAMGGRVENEGIQHGFKTVEYIRLNGKIFDPIKDDAQALELVRRFKLGIVCFQDARWGVHGRKHVSQDGRLTRAICECVAKMQAAKADAQQV